MKEFLLEYNKLYEAEDKLVKEAKLFIVDNWQKVVYHRMTLLVNNLNTKDNKNKEVLGRYSMKAPDFYIPSGYYQGAIHKVDEVIYDSSDGDMSLTITNTEGVTKEWWWIDNNCVISLAQYIQDNL